MTSDAIDVSPEAGGQEDRGKSPGLTVILCGLATTVATLVLVYLLQQKNIEPMSLYFFLILPLGAILVGLLAGSGYAFGSWWTGAKIGGGLLALVLLLQVGAYFAAQYVEYSNARKMFDQNTAALIDLMKQANGGQMDEAAIKETEDQIRKKSGIESFPQYFDASTRKFAFDGDNGPGDPLEIWGYGIRLLEMLGFGLGSLIIPLILKSQPYCAKCQVYQKALQLGLLPAGVQPRKVKKKDVEGQEALANDADEAMQGGIQLMEETAELAQAGQASAFTEMMKEIKGNKKEIGKQSSRIQVSMHYCPDCHEGQLVYALVSGQGEESVVQPLASYDVGTDFVRSVKVGV